MNDSKAFPPGKHAVYTANKVIGNRIIKWGKCLCGATLEDDEQVEEHLRLMKEHHA